jgi:plastocyanin
LFPLPLISSSDVKLVSSTLISPSLFPFIHEQGLAISNARCISIQSNQFSRFYTTDIISQDQANLNTYFNMKFTAAVSLAIAPLVTAKAVHNSYPLRRDNHLSGSASGSISGDISGSGHVSGSLSGSISGDISGSGHVSGGLSAPVGEVGVGHNFIHGGIAPQETQVIVIWAHPGGAAATTTVHEQVQVTQTVAADAGVVHDVVSSAPAAGATHHVTVGGEAGLVFTPPEIAANLGDMVIFTFMSQMHTATQSGFDTPCDPLSGGMDSQTQPNPNNSVIPPPQVAMEVMTQEPLWFYCKTGNHCGQGMVFSINPTPEKTHAQFQANAIAAKGNGGGSAITGNGTVAAAPSSAAPVPTASGAVANVATGTGAMENGACNCAVTCDMAGTYPNQAAGVGAYGGFAGQLPRSMMEVV